MSGILNTKNRDKYERYWTPKYVVEAHVEHTIYIAKEKGGLCLPHRNATHTIDIIDPFAGTGVYGRVVTEAFRRDGVKAPRIQQGDLKYGGQPWLETTRLREPAPGEACNVPLMVTNPAFTCAAPMIRYLWHRPLWRGGIVSLLLPMSFLEAVPSKSNPEQSRRDILTEMCPIDVTYVGRIMFEGPAIEARREKNLKVAKANMQYVFVTWKIGHCGPRNWLHLDGLPTRPLTTSAGAKRTQTPATRSKRRNETDGGAGMTGPSTAARTEQEFRVGDADLRDVFEQPLEGVS